MMRKIASKMRSLSEESLIHLDDIIVSVFRKKFLFHYCAWCKASGISFSADLLNDSIATIRQGLDAQLVDCGFAPRDYAPVKNISWEFEADDDKLYTELVYHICGEQYILINTFYYYDKSLVDMGMARLRTVLVAN